MASSPFSTSGTAKPTGLESLANSFSTTPKTPGVTSVTPTASNPLGLSVASTAVPATVTPAKPTTVVSSKSAATQATGPIQQSLTEAQTTQSQLANYKQLMAAQGLNPDGTPIVKAPVTPTGANTGTGGTGAPATTPGDQATIDAQNAIAHPGQSQYFNTTTGQQEWLPTSATPPAGYTTQNPQTRTDVVGSASAPGGVTVKQFSDGTYGRFNLSTGEYSQVGSADYQAAKDVESTTQELNNLRNGILTTAQQSQIDALTSQFNTLIQKQQVANANTEGATTIAQNMYGIGNSTIGAGNIKQVVNDGIAKVADLQTKMASAISDMKQAFMNDDMNLLQQAYKEFDDSNTGIQKNLDTIQSSMAKAQAKIDTANTSHALAMANKYQDTDDPILPSDTPEQVKQKLLTSPTWQQNNAVAENLTDEEAKFVGQMGLAGASLNSILPSLGLGKAATATKVAIIKSIVDNAQKLGIPAEEVAQSLMNKQAAGKTYQRLLTQGALLSSAETKVESDFQLIKKLGTKLSGNEIKSAIPALQKWIREGTLGLTNNADLNNYLANLTTTLTAYGRVVAGSTGAAGITNSANNEAQALLDKGFSVDTVNSFIDNSAIPEMKNTILGYTTSLNQMDRAINTANGSVNPTNGILGSTEGSTPLETGTGSYAEQW